MKTIESFTKSQAGELLVEFALSEIKNWARHEFRNISKKSRIPLCIELNNNHWQIGDFTIRHINSHNYTVTRWGKLVHEFYSRPAAIFYAAFTAMRRYPIADELMNTDAETALSWAETEFYKTKCEQLLKLKNYDKFKYQLYNARYINARTQFIAARQRLNIQLKTAKYHKLWETL
jgi:hypothetical protein